MPTGGGPDDDTLVEQCVLLQYLGTPSLQPKVRLVIKKVALDDTPALFAIGGSGCSNGSYPVRCVGFTFTLEVYNQSGQCSVPVKAIGKGPLTDSQNLRLTGEVYCDPGSGVTDCAQVSRLLTGRAKPNPVQLQLSDVLIQRFSSPTPSSGPTKSSTAGPTTSPSASLSRSAPASPSTSVAGSSASPSAG